MGETNRAVSFPGTKCEVYKYFNQKIFFIEIDVIIFRWKVSATRRCSVSYIDVCLFFYFVFLIHLRKQPTFPGRGSTAIYGLYTMGDKILGTINTICLNFSSLPPHPQAKL